MADYFDQRKVLYQGSQAWNKWRIENPDVEIVLDGSDIRPGTVTGSLTNSDLSGANLDDSEIGAVDLTGADLSNSRFDRTRIERVNFTSANFAGADLSGSHMHRLWWCNFHGANLSQADLHECSLGESDFSGANLYRAILHVTDFRGVNLSNSNIREADFRRADLRTANLAHSDLRGANLQDADLKHADLRNCDLRGANLQGVRLEGTKIQGAKISNSLVHGINVWDLEGEFEEQKDLVITKEGQMPSVTVDNIKVAQFVYLILNNEEIRDVINTLTSKSVLILGRFIIPERKAVLEALKNKLREYGLLPIVFDIDRPTDKDFTETILTLAGLSYFVIADITNPKSTPLELQATVPLLQVPFVPIIEERESPFAMMVDLQKKYDWVLDTLSYRSIDDLIKALKPAIIDPAIQKHNELRLIKAREPKIRSASDFIDDKRIE